MGWNGARGAAALDAAALRPVGGRLLWPGADPLWAVGDWRPDEIRSVSLYRHRRQWRHVVQAGFPDLGDGADGFGEGFARGTAEGDGFAGAPGPRRLPPDDGAVARLVVLGRCGAADSALRTALLATSGGALRHLTLWPGSYVVVLQQGARVAVLGDLAGVHPVYHTPWCGGTAYATAALPLADLIDAPVDRVHLAARLALPDAPEGVGDTSAFSGVRCVPPGQALSVRAGIPDVGVYEAVPGGVGTYEMSEASATAEVTRSLLESVRLRVRTPAPATTFGLGALSAQPAPPAPPRRRFGGAGAAEGTSILFGKDPARPDAGTRRPAASAWNDPQEAVFGADSGRARQVAGDGAASGRGIDEAAGRSFDGREPGEGEEEPGGLLPRPAVSVDLSGGSASTVLALLAAGIPGAGGARVGARSGARARTVAVTESFPGESPAQPARHPVLGTFSEERWGDPRSYRSLRHGPGDPEGAAVRPRTGAVRGSWARVGGEPVAEPSGLLAITYTDSEGATGTPLSPGKEAELLRARTVAEAAADRLDHVVVPGGQETLPYAGLADDPLDGPLTDEPGPALVAALRLRARLAAAGTDHISGHGARHVLDGHPARLADVLIDRRRSPLLRPVAALARADSAVVGTPVAVVRAARRLARTAYVDGLQDAAAALVANRADDTLPGSAGEASARALAWCTPGPAAPWLTDDARAAVAQRLHLAARAGAPDERPGARRARHALQRRAADFRVLAQVVESAPDAHGQRLHAPFLDNQVVRACRLVPDRARIQPGARHGILRAVLAGAGVREIPEGWGTTAAPDPYAAAESVRAGLRQSAEALDRLFAAPLLGDWGLVDAPRVREALRAAAADEPAPLDGLADVVAMELWLRRLHARRGSCWTGLPAVPRPAVTASHVS
ncbi:asparagine synthase-related protein [Streptacidiphilus rugosus]|uniref:asparagine synthase-related protein n=1 Tax=Streptacidiphilus rugosus TaxID=405783 RepID=UPI0007C68319